MRSRILYDSRNNEIIRSQVEPHGSAGLPSKKSLIRSAYIPEDEIEFMKTAVINEEYLTYEAKGELRIVDGNAVKKPRCKLSVDKSDFDINESPVFVLCVEIKDTLENETFDEVVLSFEDIEFTLELSENSGNQQIEISEKDTYIVSCNDDRFIGDIIKVEV